MPASKAQQKAVNKYVKANYDLYQVKMPKGRKAEIKAHAETQGESVNGFINRAIDQMMAQDRRRGLQEPAESTKGAGVVSLSSEAEKGKESAQNGEEA